MGDFVFTAIAPGRYRVEVAVPGFQLARLGVEAAEAGSSYRADAVLRLGGVQERVTVSRKAGGSPVSAAPRKLRVGGNVQPPKIVKGLRPAYPATTQAAGRVLLQCVVLRDGSVANIHVITAPDAELAKAAEKAAAEMRYEPALLNGQPVETAVEIAVDFEQK